MTAFEYTETQRVRNVLNYSTLEKFAPVRDFGVPVDTINLLDDDEENQEEQPTANVNDSGNTSVASNDSANTSVASNYSGNTSVVSNDSANTSVASNDSGNTSVDTDNPNPVESVQLTDTLNQNDEPALNSENELSLALSNVSIDTESASNDLDNTSVDLNNPNPVESVQRTDGLELSASGSNVPVRSILFSKFYSE